MTIENRKEKEEEEEEEVEEDEKKEGKREINMTISIIKEEEVRQGGKGKVREKDEGDG